MSRDRRGRPDRDSRDSGRPALSPAAAKREAARKEAWRSPFAGRNPDAVPLDEVKRARSEWDDRNRAGTEQLAALLTRRLPRR
jgi:hypothetical protein